MKDRLYTFKKDSRQRRSVQTVLFNILSSLVKILSPILCFTTEEVWKNAPSLNTEKSVHLSDWPDVDGEVEKWLNPILDKKWDKLIAVRESVQKSLEAKRGEGKIGSPLDAKVILYTEDEALKKHLLKAQNILPMFLVVSQVELSDSKLKDGTVYEDTGVSVLIDKAAGTKCQRCWNYSDTVGQNKNHPYICKKCINNI